MKVAPSISVVVAAYQAEEFIAEALDAILGQTRAPNEVIVVDDGSTDGTAAVLAGYGERIRVVRRENGGCPAAFNTAFAHARGDFVAMCGADDIWEPRKLEWQEQAIVAHPEADFFFGHARITGLIEGEHLKPPGEGVLDSEAFRGALFVQNCVCAPTIVIRRSVFERLGPFIEKYGADDYDYWLRGLRAGSKFYFDPRPLVRWRQHGNNLSWGTVWMGECACDVRLRYREDVADRSLARTALAAAFFKLARAYTETERPDEARRTFLRALRYGRGSSMSANARAATWVALLSLPPALRQAVGERSVGVVRSVEALRGGRDPALP